MECRPQLVFANFNVCGLVGLGKLVFNYMPTMLIAYRIGASCPSLHCTRICPPPPHNHFCQPECFTVSIHNSELAYFQKCKDSCSMNIPESLLQIEDQIGLLRISYKMLFCISVSMPAQRLQLKGLEYSFLLCSSLARQSIRKRRCRATHKRTPNNPINVYQKTGVATQQM